MTTFDYDLTRPQGPALAALVLQSDERIELDLRRLIPPATRLFVARVPSAPDVTPDTLGSMAGHIAAAAGRLPANLSYRAIGYGCTSASAAIGADRVHELVRRGTQAQAVTEPLSALIAACAHLGLTRLAFLSPYTAPVSNRLRDALCANAIETPVFGSFNEEREEKVARIAPESIANAARNLAAKGGVDGVFLSCTNLDTLDIIPPLKAETGLPILSSNLVLGWHMCRLAGLSPVISLE
ncbi:MAG: aspartate/glutamate racemase family protein [Rhodobacteraceae bacterium]|nr:aspartate/glutamate racemase family protein [Paracoccaceae bacterium]